MWSMFKDANETILFFIIIANFDHIFKPFSKFLLRDNVYKNILKKLIRVKS